MRRHNMLELVVEAEALRLAAGILESESKSITARLAECEERLKGRREVASAQDAPAQHAPTQLPPFAEQLLQRLRESSASAKEVWREGAVRCAETTLYRHIKRLEAEGLIREDGKDAHGGRRFVAVEG